MSMYQGFLIVPIEWEDAAELAKLIESMPKVTIHSRTGEVHVVIEEAADAVQKVLELTKTFDPLCGLEDKLDE
jgi:uncharacterized protein YlzI (FlbEa/FlbD family)